MAQTANLKLNLAQASDLIDVNSAFVDNFRTLDQLGIDYVIESKTKDNWWWRKWRGGRMEMGIDTQTFATQTLYAWESSGMWITEPMSFGAYPVAFAKEPIAIIMFRREDGNRRGGDIHICGTSAKDASKLLSTSPEFRMVDAAYGRYVNPKFGIYVTGRYK